MVFQRAILLYLFELLTLLLFGAMSRGAGNVVLTDHLELADAGHRKPHGRVLTLDMLRPLQGSITGLQRPPAVWLVSCTCFSVCSFEIMDVAKRRDDVGWGSGSPAPESSAGVTTAISSLGVPDGRSGSVRRRSFLPLLDLPSIQLRPFSGRTFLLLYAFSKSLYSTNFHQVGCAFLRLPGLPRLQFRVSTEQ